MLMLNEHFLDYRAVVKQEVEAQLTWTQTQQPQLAATTSSWMPRLRST
jgi:hypothetical protein